MYRGTEEMQLVLMTGGTVPSEWTWLVLYSKGRALVTAKSDYLGCNLVI